MKKLCSILLVIALLLCAFPLTLASAEEGGVTIIADGVSYSAKKGDILEYYAYLNIGEKVTSASGNFSYDTDGMEMQIPLNIDDEEDLRELFPIFAGGTTVSERNPGYLIFTYSNPFGVSFNKDTSILIKASFTVTAETGEYRINRSLHTLQGESGTLYYSNYAQKTQPLRYDSVLNNLTAQEATEAPATEPETTQPTDSPATEPETPSTDDLFVIADGTKYKVSPNEVIEYVYYLNIGENLCSLEADLYYDSDGLELIKPLDEENEPDVSMIFPRIGDYVMLKEYSGRIRYIYTNPMGQGFKTNTAELIRTKFRVTATKGTYEINNMIDNLQGESDHLFIKDYEIKNEITRMEGCLPAKTPYDPDNPDATDPAPTEPVTIPPTDEPPTDEPATDEPATDAPATVAPTDPTVLEPTTSESSGLFVIADGVKYQVSQGEIFTYVYYLNIGEKLCSIDADLYFDPDGLELQIPIDKYDEPNIGLIFPIISPFINDNVSGRVHYVYSNPTGKQFRTDDSVLVQAQFRVTAAEGEYDVHNVLHFVAGEDQRSFIKFDEVLIPLARGEGELPSKTPYDPANPDVTDAPATAAPATESSATEPPATVAPTTKPSVTETPVTENPATVAPTTVSPTTESHATEAETDPPTSAPTEATSKGLFVSADGVLYKVKKGEIIDYVYYLNIGDRLCSLQATLYFDKEGLELLIPVDEYGDEELALLFPSMSNPMTNFVDGRYIVYNFSRPKGIPCDKDIVLIHAQFRVTADEGVYYITNVLDTIAGSNEKRYIFLEEVLEPIVTCEGELDEKTPYDPENPDATDPPTDTPTSAPTAAPTVPATEPSTNTPTAPPTEPSTSAPTDPPTEAPTEKPTRPPYLLDEPTGIRVYTDLDAELVVTVLDPMQFGYYLFQPEHFRLYDIRLVKDGVTIEPENAVTVMIPAENCKTVYFFDNGRFIFAQAVDDGSFRKLTTKKLGLFVGLTDYLNPKAALYGDVDLNGEISILDATYIQRWLAQIDPLTEDQILIGDVDANGETSIMDATYIQRWLADIREAITTRLPKK